MPFSDQVKKLAKMGIDCYESCNECVYGDACKIFSVVGFNITVPFQMREDTKVNVVLLDRESKK